MATLLGHWWVAAGPGQDPSPKKVTEPSLALDVRVGHFPTLAEKASPAVAKVFQSLAVPHDQVELTTKKVLDVEPVADYPDWLTATGGKVKLKELTGKEAVKQIELARNDILAWKPYELLAVARVAELRNDASVPELERLAGAQSILVAVWHFHLEQRQRPINKAGPWAETEKILASQLLQVRIDYFKELRESAAAEDLAAKVLPLADQLVTIYPSSVSVQTEVALARAKHAKQVLGAGKVVEAEKWLMAAEDLGPDLPAVKELRKQWQGALKLPQGKAVLRVGVRELPEFLSPALARTDAEREAVELLFESLVQVRDHPRLGQIYEPLLADTFPEVVEVGRRFALRPDAFWSTGDLVSVGDVRSTTELLAKDYAAGSAFLWSELLQPPKVASKPRQFESRFNQPFADPLLPFAFKVLPGVYQGKPLALVDPQVFALDPVGSGPFAYSKAPAPGAAVPVRFVVNRYHPFARQKHGFAEIQFHKMSDPVKQLSDPKAPLHLLLGLTEEQIGFLKSRHVGNIRSLGSRRVNFLAVNHRHPPLRNHALRKGLAMALDRSSILVQCFRSKSPEYGLLETTGAGPAVAASFLGDKLPNYHKVLNSPFPAGSWACKPDLPAELHDTEAPIWLGKAKNALIGSDKTASDPVSAGSLKSLTLTLTHPDDDPRVVTACQVMVQQIRAAALKADLDLQIQLRPLPPRKLWEAVYNHDYQLAYCSWDFASEIYWLWPLFDTSDKALAKNGSNFLGYEDAELVVELRKRMGYRDPAQLKAATHGIHVHLNQQMPLIPLWQLDYHVALHESLDTADLTSWPALSTVTQWRLK
jgi:ABC-type oligopeptide transport system substrate-binding subunit